MTTKASRQHYNIATGGKSVDNGSKSPRFAQGGFVRTKNSAHTTRGAPMGYSATVGKDKKG